MGEGDTGTGPTSGRPGRHGAAATASAPPAEDRALRILDRVREIPEGFVRTYGDIEPAAPRLVGWVLARADEEVPWHRVVRADGSAAMGVRQLELLRREGVPVRGSRVDLRRARIPR